MNVARILAAPVGAAIVLSSLLASAPAQAASPGWHFVDRYGVVQCFEQANWWHDHRGSRNERCDEVPGTGGALADLWVLIDD